MDGAPRSCRECGAAGQIFCRYCFVLLRICFSLLQFHAEAKPHSPGLGHPRAALFLPRGNLIDMHVNRVAYLARALRLSVNVLLVDADVMMFKDPYR